MCVFCLSFLVVGVWAAVSTVNFNLSGQLTFNPEGVYIKVSGQMYRGKNYGTLVPMNGNQYTLTEMTNYDEIEGVPSGNLPISSWQTPNVTLVPGEKTVKYRIEIKNVSETAISGTAEAIINNGTDSLTSSTTINGITTYEYGNYSVTEYGQYIKNIQPNDMQVYELVIELNDGVSATTINVTINFTFTDETSYTESGIVNKFVNLGTYPQTYVGDTMNSVLENEWYPTLTDDDIVSTYKVNTESVGTGTTITYNAYSYTDDNIYVRVPSAIVYASGDQTFNDGTTVTASSTYWFKVEPIKWRVLTENYTSSGNTTPVSYLLSEYLMSANFGYGHYNNNCSRLRTFLQENFNYDANLNSYDNISFTIPTKSDLENYDYNFNSDQDRIANLTDFAMVNYTSKVSGKGSYFTSTSTYSPYMTGVRYDGSLNSNYRDDNYQTQTIILAIRPAILISL